MIRPWLLLIAVAASMDAPALAQAPATVTMDATIVDAKGQPVTGLGADALRVVVDDKPRPVSAIEFISASTPDASRTLYLVVDQASVFPGAERALADVVSSVIDRLGPNDRVGLVTLPEPGPRVAPVADASEVEQALGKLTGRRSPELANFGMGVGEALAIAEGDSFVLTAVADRECRGFGSAPNARDSPVAAGGPAIANPRAECIRRLSRNVELMVAQARRASLPVFQGLLDLMTTLRDSAGSKAVVLVTGGLAVARGDDAFDELAIRAAAANASVHALLVEPSGGAGSQRLQPVNPANERRSLDRRLDELTGVARGSAQVASTGTPDVLDRLMGELSGFYRLTVVTDPRDSAVPAAGRARGRSGRVRVEVVGRSVTVRTRPFLVAPTGRARATRTPEERLADALRGGAGMRRELPLEASGSLLFGAGATVTLLVAGYVELPGTTVDEGPPVISLSYALFDERQQPVATGALPPAGEASGTPVRVTFTGGLDGLEPGRYTLRVAATDAAGRVGSAERVLQLRPTRAGALTASDLLIGRLAANGQVLPAPDVVAPDDRLGLQLDLAGSGVAGAAVRFLVLDRGGSAPVLTLPGTMDVQRPAGATATPMASATAVIGPRLLPAGEYDLRAEVLVGGAVAGQVLRSIAVRGVAAAGAGAPVVSAALIDQVWALAPRFARESMRSPDLLGPALDRLAAEATGPRAQAAIAAARAGTLVPADEALRRESALASAFLTGAALLASPDLEQAAREFREALRVSSDFFPAAIYLGACYAAGGKDREAAGAWQTALIGESANPALYRLLVEALLRVRDLEAATEILDEARGKWPDAAAMAVPQAMVALVRGERAEALTLVDGLSAPPPDLLFVAIGLLYEASVAGRPVATPAEDRARMVRYAERYAALGGPQQALVLRWLAALKAGGV